MKILHVINSFEGGGAEKLMLQLHELSLNQGIDSHAVSIMRSSAGGLPNTHSLNFNHPYELSVPFKLYSFLSQSQWKSLDIIHVHLFPAQFFTALISRYIKLKAILITTEHSTFNYRRNKLFGKLLDKFFYSFYTKVVCISHGTSTSLLQSQPQLIQKIPVIYNGIDIQKYLPNHKLVSESNIPIIISIGRLVELKNHKTAIRALGKISDQAFEYWILGSGFLEPQLKELVNSLNLESKVKFLGFRTDVADLLQQADIFILTSLSEGFGLSVVEAMAAGLPVIVSNVPGLREVIINENNEISDVGFLIDPLSEDDIVGAVKRLLNDPILCLEMSRNSQLRAFNFDIKKTFEQYNKLYESLLDK
jgi:glycosyltransferase involved in cell wall biosynthesis